MEASSSGVGNDQASSPPSTSATTFPDFLQKDTKGLWIFGESESKRRLILIERQNGSFGFTLQSYGVRYKHGHRETDFITYVNAVEKNGAAELAGLREGDVILSINGQNMARVEHKSLVSFIRQCPTTLKMVVVSDERARKVELHMRYVHLQKKLQDKLLELDDLNSREKAILAGQHGKSSICNGAGTLGAPCLAAAASSVCCFCPPVLSSKDKRREEIPALVVVNPGPSTATISILQPNSDIEEAKLQHVIQLRSKSVKLPSEKSTGSSSKPDSYYLDSSYRKCQSSRELNRKDSVGAMENPGTTGAGTTPTHCHHHHRGIPSEKPDSVKPVSWDSLIGTGSTKSFGGYGYGYAYGYFPNSSTKESAYRGGGGPSASSSAQATGMTHPHHHNHHIHSQCSRGQSYYKGEKHCSDASKVKVVYNYVAPTYHTMLPKMANLEDLGRRHFKSGNTPTKTRYGVGATQIEKQHMSMGLRSKTLPSSRNSGSISGEVGTVSSKSNQVQAPGKLEKTFSDSSLSDHYKELSLAYFQRSGDNVRFSSEEDFDSYMVPAGRSHEHRKVKANDSISGGDGSVSGGRRGRSKSAGKERERIFV